jgi:hypothetical protein
MSASNSLAPDPNSDHPEKKILGDKIFGAHNNPSKEFTYHENFEVDWTNPVIDDAYDEEEYTYRKKLEEEVYEAFQSSRWHPLNFKKKIPRDLLPLLFQEVLEKMGETEYSFSERFVCICDLISVPYSKAYESIPIKYREIIISELENKYGVLSKRKIKRLF